MIIETLKSLTTHFLQSHKAKPDPSERMELARSLMENEGMDLNLTVRQVLIALPFFEYGLIYHDIAHALGNAVTGIHSSSETPAQSGWSEDAASIIEHVLYDTLFDNRLINPEILRYFSPEGLKDLAHKHHKRRIKDSKNSGEGKYTKLFSYEGREQWERLIDRGLSARQFFTAVTGIIDPWTVKQRHMVNLPFAFFGTEIIMGPDGKAAGFELYPAETRKAVINALKVFDESSHKLPQNLVATLE